ncbi:Retrovirus-related Pol poly from transposon 297 [Solea senegalensis]|uniref:Gypsy retrotransposon integrase-like protein 1 n=1 Tax=Solea senegalensis TaxID=28829 RepID=A0AAV6PIC5_SOLSE|nr:uncharacterized protein LOC122763220 isoform X2 [Solea senegalensis]KAG7464302.1 Retrovirus-related Pol poly from transposon 297 [Solea senegalensis]
MASGSAFSVEEFVAKPTLSQLDICRKADLFAIADRYDIKVTTSLLKKELKAAVIDGLVEGGVCGLPATVPESAGEVCSEARGAEATQRQRDILNITPGVKHGSMDEKQFTLPRFEPLSVETTPGSRIDARIKLRLARLQLENEEREREREREFHLKLKRMELDAETAVKMRELELQSSSVSSDARSSSSSTTFDVSKNVSLVPVFRESEVECYLGAFERIAAALHWPKDVWPILLQCKLTGKAQEACASLSVEDGLSYEKVKSAILQVYELVPEAYRQRFRGLRKTASQTYADFAREKGMLFDRWCSSCKADNFNSIRELMLLEEFKNQVPERTVVYLNEQKVTTLQQAAILADEFALTHRSPFIRRDSPTQPETAFRSSDTRVPRFSTSLSAPKADKQCFFCHKADHLIADCNAWKRKQQAAISKPKGVGLVKTVTGCSPSPSQTVPDECFKPFIFPAFVSLTGKVDDQRPVTVLRDTGGSQSFILSSVLPLSTESACDTSAIVRGIGMRFVPAPLHRIHVQSNLKTGFFRVAVRSSFPIDGVGFIMGNDIAGGKVYPSPEVVDNPVAESRHDDLVQCHPDIFSVSVLTRGQARKQAQDIDLSDSVFASAVSEDRLPPTRETGNWAGDLEKCEGGTEPVAVHALPLTREALISSQSGDPSMRKCFAAVEDHDKCTEGQSFFLDNGVLMRRWISPLGKTNAVSDCGSVCQIVVPVAYRQHVLELAHDHPWSGHLGVTKTHDRILKHFFWPGMKKEVTRFCKTCSTCQVVGKPNQVVPPAPLHPIPAVGEPFERVLVDCVGPLPRTKSGNQFLLTVMCATTRFPEAIPLRRITAPAITRALIKFFTMFGLPKVVQTDQGTNFLSRSFKQTLYALGITHSVSSAYHPQSQGALERWHQTLKSMLRKYCHDTGRDWDEGVPFTLFAIREAKQESLGFSPAELVFGHNVRGPLKVLKEKFLCNISPQTTVQDFVSQCKERLRNASALAKVALSSSQESMKERFDRKAVKREFEPGERVLVLLPTPGSALTARFSGPYVIKSKVSDTNYVIHTPERRRKVRLCHINMLKSYHSREANQGEQEKTPETAASRETTTSLVCVESLPDDGLTVLGSDQQSGRLSNTEFLAKIDTHLNYLPVDQQRDIVSLMRSHPSLFNDVPSSTNVLKHDIDVGSASPIKQHAYRCPLAKRELMKKEANYLLENGLAVPSCSPWSSPCLLAPKSDGTPRFCTDYRKIKHKKGTDNVVADALSRG